MSNKNGKWIWLDDHSATLYSTEVCGGVLQHLDLPYFSGAQVSEMLIVSEEFSHELDMFCIKKKDKKEQKKNLSLHYIWTAAQLFFSSTCFNQLLCNILCSVESYMFHCIWLISLFNMWLITRNLLLDIFHKQMVNWQRCIRRWKFRVHIYSFKHKRKLYCTCLYVRTEDGQK